MSFFKRGIVRYAAAALAGIALFAGGMLTGTSLAPRAPEETAPAADPVDAELVQRLTAAAQTNWSVSFTRCPHTVTLAGESLVGMSREEIAKKYPAFDITEFTAKRVQLTRTVEGCCPKHLFVRLEGGKVSMKRMDADTLKFVQESALDAGGLSLDEATQKELEGGLLFESMEEINAYFESADS